MYFDKYELRSGNRYTIFEFTSEGPKGNIQKIVQFTRTNIKGVYNLAFGDKIGNTIIMDDVKVSNNGDRAKVLSTVAAAVHLFTEKKPGAWIHMQGCTRARNRLYRMFIGKVLPGESKKFEVFGNLNIHWVPFEPVGEYKAFLIKRKSLKLQYYEENNN